MSAIKKSKNHKKLKNHDEDSASEELNRQILKKLGLKINKQLFLQKRSADWLSLKTGVARSTVREIIAGRSNPRILTLNALALGLGFRDIVHFLQS